MGNPLDSKQPFLERLFVKQGWLTLRATSSLVKFLQHPVWVVGGCWIVLVLAGAVAWRSLSHYELSEEPTVIAQPSVSVSPQPLPVVKPISPDRGNADSVPPWSLGIVAVGGAIGSMLIAQRLRQPQTVKRLFK